MRAYECFPNDSIASDKEVRRKKREGEDKKKSNDGVEKGADRRVDWRALNKRYATRTAVMQSSLENRLKGVFNKSIV